MSLVDMAMALESNLVYSGMGAGIQAPECWSTANWESGSGTVGSWEWEDPAMSRLGDGPVQRSGWASAGCSVVSSFSKSGGTASGTSSISSGIPGVGGGGGDRVLVVSTLVKDELDENGQAPIGQGHAFVSLGQSLSPERPRGGGAEAAGGLSNGSSVMSGGGYCQNVTLKLRRRTYFEDPAAAAEVKGASPTCSPPGKKQRPLFPSVQIPLCQVEGCKADLSRCKDYHKRHKVCEMHSKAPNAIAGGIEQRFCQQCSRFHVLKEFDEGKRSCRRRLAGHNERRRKPPHPETHSLFGLGNSFLHTPLYFSEDSKSSNLLNPHRSSLLDCRLHGYGSTRSSSWSLKGRDDNIPTFQFENLKAPSTSSKSFSSVHLGGHHFLEGPSGLSLSSSTGGVLGNLEQSQTSLGSRSQALSSVSGMMNSGRALSLLSSQSWASRPSPGASSTPVSVGLSETANSTLEQLVASSSCSAHHLCFPSSGSSTSAQQQLFSVQSGARLDSLALNCGLAATGSGTTHQRQSCSNVGNMLGGYQESNSMLAILGSGQGLEAARSSDFGAGSHQSRPTMELMQQMLLHSVGAPHSSGNQYSNGFSSHGPLESSIFTSQQFL